MLFYGIIFKIIKYKNLKIKYSIQNLSSTPSNSYQNQVQYLKIKCSWSHYIRTANHSVTVAVDCNLVTTFYLRKMLCNNAMLKNNSLVSILKGHSGCEI